MATSVSSWRTEIAGVFRGCPNPVIDMQVIEACRDICKETRLWTKKLSAIDVIAVTGTDIAFVHGSPCTITSTSTDFTDVAGDSSGLTFVSGMRIIPWGTSDNEREVIVETVAANTLTLYSGEHVESESAGGSVTLSAADYGLASLVSTIGDIALIKEAIFDDNDPMIPVSPFELDKWEPGWKTSVSNIPTRYTVDKDFRIRLIDAPDDELQGGLIVEAVLMPLRSATTVEDFLYTNYMKAVKYGALEKLFRMEKAPWYDIEKAEFYHGKLNSELDEAFDRGLHGFTTAQGGISG